METGRADLAGKDHDERPGRATRGIRARRRPTSLLLALVSLAACSGQPPRATPTSPLGRPYSPSSPWNTPVGAGPVLHPQSADLVRSLGKELTSDPTQYTMPVYEVTHATPRVPVQVLGRFSDVDPDGRSVVAHRSVQVAVPLPEQATASPGSDAHVVVVDLSTGEEWGLWQARRSGTGWTATNGYHYSVRSSGVPPTGFGSRGAGLPYLAGLVRPWELAAGRIDHAVAFAFPHPSCAFTPPATKSDGRANATALPEGARLQLDPQLGEQEFDRWGLDRTARLIARALQRYGMIVVDVSGRPKVYLEAQSTAQWDQSIGAATVSRIPLEHFRVLDFRGQVSLSSCSRARVTPASPAPTDAAGFAPAGS